MAKFIFSVCEFKETEDLVAMTMPEKLSIFFQWEAEKDRDGTNSI